LDGALNAIHVSRRELIITGVTYFVVCDACAIYQYAVVGSIDIWIGARLDEFMRKYFGGAIMSGERAGVIHPSVVSGDTFVGEALMLPGKLCEAVINAFW